MNAEQKKRIAHEISNWKNACNCRAVQLTGDRMAALLQELIDAPETEPVARVTGYYAGYLSIETIDGRVLPAGTAVYTSPPAPSVPPVRSTGQWESSRIADYNRGWNDCREATEKALNDLEKRK